MWMYILVLLLIWAAGFVISAMCFAWRYCKAVKEIHTYRLCGDERCKGIMDRVAADAGSKGKPAVVQIRCSDKVSVPMGFGVFRKSILLPEKAEEIYSERELYFILRHEYIHFQNGDLGGKFFLRFLCCLLWWLPGIGLLERDLTQAFEIRCDLDVTRGMEPSERAEYLITIVNVLKRTSKPQRRINSAASADCAQQAKRMESPGRTSPTMAGGRMQSEHTDFPGLTEAGLYREKEIIERFRLVSADFDMSQKSSGIFGIWLLLGRNRVRSMKNTLRTSINTSVTLKALLRSPLKTALTFVLVAAASFALFSRVMDYAVTSREVKNAENYYHGVAALDTTVPEITLELNSVTEGYVPVLCSYTPENKPWPEEEKLREFSSLPGVTLADTRYMTAGTVEDYERLFEYENSRRVVEVILDCTYAGYENSPSDPEGNSYIDLKWDNVKVLACEEELDIGSSVVMEQTPLGDNLYFQTACPRSFYDDLEIGARCLVRGYFFGGTPRNQLDHYLSLFYAMGEEAFCILDGGKGSDLEAKIPAEWQRSIDGIRQNRYIYDIVYTSDTRAIPSFNERNTVIAQGRPLTAEDTTGCVVNEQFLKKYGLAVGDTIRVRLGDQLHSQKIAFDGTRNSLQGNCMEVSAEAELEIVGAYRMSLFPSGRNYEETMWSYTPSTIFVPRALLAAEIPADHEYMPGEYSVFVENARDIERFRNAAEVCAADMNLGLRFSDGGWMSVKESFEVGTFTSLLTTAAYAVGGAAALLLAVYLYIGRNKKSYAILRTLGVPGVIAGNSLALPFVALTALAIPAGGSIGLFYAKNTADRTLADMIETAPSGYVLNVGLPVGVVLVCLLSELMFIAAAIVVFLRKMHKTPPLELLQEGSVSVGRVRKAAKVGTAAKHVRGRIESVSPLAGFDGTKIAQGMELPAERKYGAARQVLSYVLRHMRRGVGKTAISLLLTIVLTGGIGMLALTRHTFREAFDSLEVKGRAVDFSSGSVTRLSESALTKDVYYYGGFSVQMGDTVVPLTVTSDPRKYLGNAAAITYGEGFDSSKFNGTDQICLVGQALAENFGIAPGDTVRMCSGLLYATLKDDTEISENALEQMYKSYRVAGVFSSGEQEMDTGILTAITDDTDRLYGQPFPVSYCEFILADNDKSGELNELLQREYSLSTKYTAQAGFHLDLEALHNIGRICAVLESLFPIAVTAAVLIGLSGSLLLILQSSLEAVLLRALGVTKKRARCMLVLEQALLCVLGLMLVAVGMMLTGPGLPVKDARTIILCFALYAFGCVCGAAAAAIQVTGGRIIEYLQSAE